jgi:cytochrome c-type biogenesis protein
VIGSCLLFLFGFSLVFVAMGAAAGEAGRWIHSYRFLFARISGGLIILLGLFVMGLVKVKPLYGERRFRFRRFGWLTAPLAGMAFAFGWTPCVGPFLGAILALAAASGTSNHGAFYLAAYSAGLGLPFLLSALLLTSLMGTFGWVKRHFNIVAMISGGLLAAMGIFFLAGGLGRLTDFLYLRLGMGDVSLRAMQGAPLGLLTSFAAGLLSFLSPCVLPLVPGYLSFISGVAVEDLLKSEAV